MAQPFTVNIEVNLGMPANPFVFFPLPFPLFPLYFFLVFGFLNSDSGIIMLGLDETSLAKKPTRSVGEKRFVSLGTHYMSDSAYIQGIFVGNGTRDIPDKKIWDWERKKRRRFEHLPGKPRQKKHVSERLKRYRRTRGESTLPFLIYAIGPKCPRAKRYITYLR